MNVDSPTAFHFFFNFWRDKRCYYVACILQQPKNKIKTSNWKKKYNVVAAYQRVHLSVRCCFRICELITVAFVSYGSTNKLSFFPLLYYCNNKSTEHQPKERKWEENNTRLSRVDTIHKHSNNVECFDCDKNVRKWSETKL